MSALITPAAAISRHRLARVRPTAVLKSFIALVFLPSPYLKPFLVNSVVRLSLPKRSKCLSFLLHTGISLVTGNSDWRIGRRGNFDQVQFLVARHLQSFLPRKHTNLTTVISYNTQLWRPNILIQTGKLTDINFSLTLVIQMNFNRGGHRGQLVNIKGQMY